MKKILDSEIQEIDQLIKAGESQTAKSNLKQVLGDVDPNRLERTTRLTVAKLFRRLNEPLESYRYLFGLIFPRRSSPVMASNLEKIEFACSLQLLGDSLGARRVLDSLEGVLTAQALQIYYFIDITEWNFDKAIPKIKKSLELIDSKDYEYAVALHNLLVCQSSSRERETEQTFQQVELALKDFPASKLRGESHVYLADYRAATGNLEGAIEALSQARNLYPSPSRFDELRFKILEQFISWETKLNPEKLRLEYHQLREAALEIDEYESLREIDALFCRYITDQALYDKLSFGTPYPGFHRFLDQTTQRQYLKSGTFHYNNQTQAGVSPKIWIDVELGTSSCGHSLSSQKSIHNLFKAFCSDLYHPFSIDRLIFSLEPNYGADLESARARMYQRIHRLKQWLITTKAEIEITEVNKGQFALQLGEACLVYGTPRLTKQTSKAKFEDLPRSFTASQLAQRYGYSKRSAQLKIQDAIRRGLLEKCEQQRFHYVLKA